MHLVTRIFARRLGIGKRPLDASKHQNRFFSRQHESAFTPKIAQFIKNGLAMKTSEKQKIIYEASKKFEEFYTLKEDKKLCLEKYEDPNLSIEDIKIYQNSNYHIPLNSAV